MRQRSTLHLVVAVVLGLTVLVGCGTDDEDTTTPSPIADTTDPSSAADAAEQTGAEESADDDTSQAATEGETRTVESLYGPVEVPVAPQRVFTLDEYAGAAMIYSGVEPVASFAPFRARIPLAILDRSGVEVTEIAFGEWSVEAIAAIEPDMIVMTDLGDPTLVETLNGVAPTVAVPFIAPWPDIVDAVGGASGRPDVAVNLSDELNARLAELAATAPEASVFSVLASGPQFGTYSIAEGAVGSSVLEQAGYTRPEAQLVPPDFGVSLTLSPETLGDHDGDYVLQLGGDEAFYSVEELQALPTFQGISAVDDGRTGVGLGEIWTSFDPFSVFWMTEDLLAIRAGRAPGTFDDLDRRWEAFLAVAAA
ncbi:MAG: ABC transporter substrate-binding protein [Actinomycetota bacterium]